MATYTFVVLLCVSNPISGEMCDYHEQRIDVPLGSKFEKSTEEAVCAEILATYMQALEEERRGGDMKTRFSQFEVVKFDCKKDP